MHACDLDQDGDSDILATICQIHEVLWFENDSTGSFTTHVISQGFQAPRSVVDVDMDADGDIDVLVAAIFSNGIGWCENDGSQSFTTHMITTTFVGAADVYPADFDEDGDVDVVGSAKDAHRVAWWESDLAAIQEDPWEDAGSSPMGPTMFGGSIRLPSDERWEVYDITGRPVHPDRLEPGVYFIAIDGAIAQKIIKIR